MSKRVSFKLRGENVDAALRFANEVGQPLDKIAEIAFFRYVNDVLDKAVAMAEKAAAAPATVPTTDSDSIAERV